LNASAHVQFDKKNFEVVQRRRARKWKKDQSGITEESAAEVQRSERGVRTNFLLILENYINNLSGTDGHRTIGRPWHISPLKSSTPVEAICWSIRNTQLLPHPEMIPSPEILI
jgi:hypothetical protein